MPKYKVGDMVVGYRFAIDMEKIDTTFGLKMRGGLGRTMVIDQEILSGPIYLGGVDGRYLFVRCYNCLARTKNYKIFHSALEKWAHDHRCDKRKGVTH